MALRFICVGLALAMLTTTGCRTSSNYRPACPPSVVATTPVAVVPAAPAPCAQQQLPPPPPLPPIGR